MYRSCFFMSIMFSALVFCSCQSGSGGGLEKAKQEIVQAEKDFEKMAAEKGIAEAFGYFADSNAVIRGANDSLIRGKEGIRNFFSADRFKSASVKWSPDFADASSSGDLGYTYGKYTWQSKDSTGKTNESSGIFHTVWKKQKDGSWKFVWD
jgi:ketosteroid isomerase-like protein